MDLPASTLDAARRTASNRPLMWTIFAGAASGLGDWLYLTALPVHVYLSTGDPALVGIIAVARFLPLIGLSIPAGVLADRRSPRSLLIATGMVRAIAMVLIAILATSDAEVAPLAIVAVVASAAGTFAMPAQARIIPLLARDDMELGRANALFTTLDGIGGILGPAIAGLFVLVGALPLAFALNGLSFLAFVVVLAARAPIAAFRGPTRRSGPHADASRSPAKLWDIARSIARPLALDWAISFAGASMAVLPVVVAVDSLHADASFAGALNAGGGIGAVAGGLLVGVFVNTRPRTGVVLGVVGAALSLAMLSVTATPAVAVGLLGVTTGSLILLDALNTTTLQRLTSDGATGRAFGLLHTLAGLWMIAGSFVPAAVVAAFGAGPAIQSTAVFVAGLGVVSLVPARHRTGRSDEVSPIVQPPVPGTPEPAA